MKTKYTARMLFKDFRDTYPELWRYGSEFELCGFMTILIKIPTVGVVVYEYFGNKITWLERWEDPKDLKRRKKELRLKEYDYFKFIVLDKMELEKLSQRDVANITGYSRKSINEYLSGKSIPKRSTMVAIMDALGVEGF